MPLTGEGLPGRQHRFAGPIRITSGLPPRALHQVGGSSVQPGGYLQRRKRQSIIRPPARMGLCVPDSLGPSFLQASNEELIKAITNGFQIPPGLSECGGAWDLNSTCSAGGGIRTHEPLRDEVLSLAPLTRLGDPRSVSTASW